MRDRIVGLFSDLSPQSPSLHATFGGRACPIHAPRSDRVKLYHDRQPPFSLRGIYVGPPARANAPSLLLLPPVLLTSTPPLRCLPSLDCESRSRTSCPILHPSVTMLTVRTCSGAGIGGLTCAIALAKFPDIEIVLYEAASQLCEVGAGVGIFPRMF